MKTFELKVGGKEYKVDIERFDGKQAAVKVNGKPFEVDVKQAAGAIYPGMGVVPPAPVAPTPAPMGIPQPTAEAPEPTLAAAPYVPTGGQVVAPMPGLILEVLVAVGDMVSAGAPIIKIEAMKMENQIPAPVSGTIKEILAKKGDRVQTDDILAVIDEG